ncbi:acyl-CoA dehydrogenase [Comamonas serinivorans]|uniref:Acyl-CoA dehydrogenase n=1 Tax=Comamonas serinivorans TaxID=1082851 RepID=A0A1Y0ELQ3_9BURK|nr:acyl-CoA dehydrogenase [Comamonas serinivorans]ARU04279.1 acyl-CoA dehydrogenase [Comamonas serinivorans]
MSAASRDPLTRGQDLAPELLQTLQRFIDEAVIPAEDLKLAHDHAAQAAVVARLQGQALALGLGSPRRAVTDGGLGLSWEACCDYLEQAGRSFLGPAVLQCAPPTQPDVYALDVLATPSQRRAYLDPLKAGTRKSCFAMTEPAPGAGSDPRMLKTEARQEGGQWVINGHKWFITGAHQADFAIVVARTDDGVSWFLVDADTPGFEIVRDVPTMEPFDMGGHAEIRLTNCRVGADALVGEAGKGLDHAQLRLEGARLFHCMRFIGLASRAMHLAQRHVQQRESHGARLAEHQMVQALVADAHIQLFAARVMTREVARQLDRGESIRHSSSMAKVFVSEAVYQVADSAVQICGALGVSEDLPLSMILRMLRPFRIYDGASEVHRSAIAKRAFRHDLRP